jgi:hypothetical protein
MKPWQAHVNQSEEGILGPSAGAKRSLATIFHQVGERVGLHLLNDLASMCLYGDLADTEFATDLLIQQTGDVTHFAEWEPAREMGAVAFFIGYSPHIDRYSATPPFGISRTTSRCNVHHTWSEQIAICLSSNH